MNHITIGVYTNGESKVNFVENKHLEDHIEYNKTYRVGRALFVDGKCVHEGYLNKDEVAAWEDKIKDMSFNSSKPSEIYQ
jgi:hypothetical protein